MAEQHFSLDNLEDKILGKAPDHFSLTNIEDDLVQLGSSPTPEPKPTIKGEPSAHFSLKDIEALAPQVGSFGLTDPYPGLKDNDEDRDLKWYTNFFNSLYANTIPTFKSAMAELSGDHDKAKFIMQEVQKTYDAHSKSAYAGGIASSVLTTAAALGSAMAAPVAGGLIMAGYLGYHAVMGMGQAKGLVKEYEEESGKDVSAIHETAATIGGGLVFLVAEKTGAKYLMKGGLLKKEVLKEIGQAWIKKDTKKVTSLMLQNVPQSMVRGGLVEGAEEGLEQVMGNFIQATYDPEARDFEDIVAGVPEAMVAGSIAGMILGGGISVAQTSSRKSMTALATDMMNTEERNRVVAELEEAFPESTEEERSAFTLEVSARARALDIPLHEWAQMRIAKIKRGNLAEAIKNEKNQLFHLVGLNAKLTPKDRQMQLEAETLLGEGKNREEVFARTGWLQGESDNMWRKEIDSSKMKLSVNITDVTQQMDNDSRSKPTYTLGNLVEYDELFSLYPKAKNIEVTFKKLKKKILGTYSDDGKRVEIDPQQIRDGLNDLTLFEAQFSKTLAHEVQHNIQYREGFAQGGMALSYFGTLFEDGYNPNRKGDREKLITSIQDQVSVRIKALNINLPADVLDQLLLKLPDGFIRSLYDNTHFVSSSSRTIDRTSAVINAVEEIIQSVKATATIQDIQAFDKLFYDKYNDTTLLTEIANLVPKYYGKGANFIRGKYNSDWEAYRAVAGEQEARDVANRMVLSDAERVKVFPQSGKTKGLIYYNNELDISSTFSENDVETYSATDEVVGDILEHKIKGKKAGSIELLKDGRSIIRAFESANVETMFHELGHLFFSDLTTAELETAEKIFGVKKGKWTVKQKEAFADSYVTWHRTGKTKNKQMVGIFERIQKWLVNLYKGTLAETQDITVSKEVANFFDSLFMKESDTLFTDPIGQDKKANILSRWAKKMYNGVLDKVDIEYRANRMGWKYIGLAGKKMMSIVSHFQKEGQGVIAGMFDSLVGKGMNTKQARVAINKLVLLYEDKAKWKALSKGDRESMQGAYDILDNYLKTSLEEYKDRGVLEMGFVERITATLHQQLLTAESKRKTTKNKNKIIALRKSLKEAENLQYVPIPLGLWLDSQMAYNPRVGKAVLSILANKTRETFRIADIIDTIDSKTGKMVKKGFNLTEGDIRMGDIIASYSYRKGKDMANLDLREAAIKDKQVKIRPTKKDGTPSKKLPTGFKLPSKNLPFLRGYVIKDEFGGFMGDITRRVDSIGLPSKVLNIAKMTAFWNPLFLPMYDTIQAAMLGSFNPLRPIKSYKYIKQAWEQVRTHGDIYQRLDMSGLFSTPFANPLSSHTDMLQAMATKGKYQHRKIYKNLLGEFISSYTNPIKHAGTLQFGKVKQDLKTLVRNAFGLKTIYNFSWKTAWMLDNTVRVASGIYLHDTQKMSWEDSAQRGALFHGDYAGVPANTRRHLNRLFFTPTFKIAMGKLYINMLSGFGNSLHPTVKSNKQYRDNRMAVVRMVAVLSAWDMLMMSLGYDRDEWGRRYVKEVDTDKGLKESTITWSGPHNLFLKYLYRAQSAMGPAVDNSIASFLKSNKWEIHPLYRVALEIKDNKKPNGDQIVSTFDSSILRGQAPIKEVKQVSHLLRGVVSILQLIGDEFEDPIARAQLQKEMQQTAGMILGTAFSQASRPFTFTYLRDIEPVRAAQGLQSLGIYLSRDLNNLFEKVGTLDPAIYEVMVEEYLQRVNEVLLEADLMEYDLDDEPH